MRVISASASPLGHEIITVESEAISSLTPAKYARAITAYILVEGGPIRFWVDGSDPSDTEGFLLIAGESIELDSPAEISKFRATATAADSTLTVAYSA